MRIFGGFKTVNNQGDREVSCQEIMSALDSRYRRLKLDNFNRNNDFCKCQDIYGSYSFLVNL